MARSLLLLIFASLLLVQCQNLDDAEPADRSSFVFFYEKPRNYDARVLEPYGSGFLMGGNLTQQRNDLTSAIISQVDSRGNIVWEVSLDSSSVSAIKPVSDGVLVWGHRIALIDTAANLNDRIITSAQLFKLSASGSVVDQVLFRDIVNNERTADIAGDALIVENDRIIVTGNSKIGTNPTVSFTAELSPTTLQLQWLRRESFINRNYENTANAFFTDNQNIIWGAGAAGELQNTDFSYVVLPVVPPSGPPINIGQYGENDQQNYRVGAIAKSALGFGVTGTYVDISARTTNLYFLRFDRQGNFIEGSDIFLDAIDSQNNEPLTDKAISKTDEAGLAIAAIPSGGFIVAGSMNTTTGNAIGNRGNGGTDLWLIRLDAFGNVVWNKTFGGSGDEEPRAAVVTADGGFVICGSSTVANLKSIFLLKTDRNGEIEQ
ncbi:MAG: hypothetical protein MUC38_12165 [Cyclobacteriaceae bacterium]|jgi:hypothetical protein|nr:hypothetical protein [Cyclobacteriaceae bacterium]